MSLWFVGSLLHSNVYQKLTVFKLEHDLSFETCNFKIALALRFNCKVLKIRKKINSQHNCKDHREYLQIF